MVHHLFGQIGKLACGIETQAAALLDFEVYVRPLLVQTNTYGFQLSLKQRPVIHGRTTVRLPQVLSFMPALSFVYILSF